MEAAFFDLDKTVIAKASMMAFGRPFYREGLISKRSLARGAWAQLIYLHLGASEEKLARIRESVLALTRGWEQSRVREIVAETLEAVVEPITYAEALELIDQHKAAGRRVYIISASPVEIVEPLGRFLGVDEALASRPRIDRDGRYTGEMDVYAYGPLKAELIRAAAAREGITLEGSYAYSDSYTDLPMLEAVGHPVVVNPDRPLQKTAKDREWEVREFVRPVRLRDRMPARAGRATTAVGVSVAVGGAAALVVWRLRSRQPVRPVGPARPGGPAGRPRWPAGVPRWPGGVPRWPAGGPRWPAGLPRWPDGPPKWPARSPAWLTEPLSRLEAFERRRRSNRSALLAGGASS